LHVDGLIGSAISIHSLFKKAEHPFDCFKQQTAYYLNDLEQLIGEQDVLFYPGSFVVRTKSKTDNANVLLRAEVLNRINSRKSLRLLLAIEALFEK
jgi:transcription-repair coupling factor (superfamily II helicase)